MRLALQRVSIRGFDFKEVVGIAASSGFRGFEANLDEAIRSYSSLEEFKKALERSRLQLSATYWSSNFHLEEEREKVLSQAVATLDRLTTLGAQYLVIGPPSRFKSFEGKKQEYIGCMAETLNQIDTGGIQMGVHNHWGTIIQTSDEIDLLMSKLSPKVGLFCDIGHLSVSGVDVLGTIRKYSDRIKYIHLKDDSDPGRQAANWSQVASRFKPPGSGKIDHEAVIGNLKQAGFGGWVTVEFEDPGTNPLEQLDAFRRYYEAKLKRFFE